MQGNRRDFRGEPHRTGHGHKDRSSLTPRRCEYHEKLITGAQTGDAIITFNYDCLIDATLKAHGNQKWHARSGYGFTLKGARIVKS